jgi:hypothetical protein
MDQFCYTTNRFYNTVELHLSGLIGMVSHPDMQKIQKLDFSLKIGYIGSFKFTCSSSASSGPEAYAPDAPQPIGLLCDPRAPVILDVPTSSARRLHVHMTQEILAAKG